MPRKCSTLYILNFIKLARDSLLCLFFPLNCNKISFKTISYHDTAKFLREFNMLEIIKLGTIERPGLVFLATKRISRGAGMSCSRIAVVILSIQESVFR